LRLRLMANQLHSSSFSDSGTRYLYSINKSANFKYPRSSPPDALVLHSTTIVLNIKIAAASVEAPIRTYVCRLSGIAA